MEQVQRPLRHFPHERDDAPARGRRSLPQGVQHGGLWVHYQGDLPDEPGEEMNICYHQLFTYISWSLKDIEEDKDPASNPENQEQAVKPDKQTEDAQVKQVSSQLKL